ncbi:hypothetical protein ABWK52_28865, partial [Bacillus sp. AP50]
VDGETKNIELLGKLKIKELWVFAVNQEQFDNIMTHVNPELLYVYKMRVENLSILQMGKYICVGILKILICGILFIIKILLIY